MHLQESYACAWLQGLAGQMQGICQGAGAPVLVLTLPEEEEESDEEEEEEDEEDEQENVDPNHAKLYSNQEVCCLCKWASQHECIMHLCLA